MRDFVAALQGTNVTAECEASTGDQANGVYMYQDPDCAQGGLGCTGTNNCRFWCANFPSNCLSNCVLPTTKYSQNMRGHF